MDKNEANKIIKILETADGGCSYCVSDLLKSFGKEFPEHKGLAKEKLIKVNQSLKNNRWC